MIDLKRCYQDAAENHIFGETELLPDIELALVFGNKRIIDELAESVARDYHRGQFARIMTLGGIETACGRTEADAIADTLIQNYKIPPHAVLRETESRNTLENAVKALEKMKQHLGDEPAYSIVGYGHAYAGMRFLWTMNKVFTSSVLMFKQVFPSSYTTENAFLSKVFRDSCQQQFERLPFYASSNYVSPVTLADINGRVQSAFPARQAA